MGFVYRKSQLLDSFGRDRSNKHGEGANSIWEQCCWFGREDADEEHQGTHRIPSAPFP